MLGSTLSVCESAGVRFAQVDVGWSDVDAHDGRRHSAVFCVHQGEVEDVGADLLEQVLESVSRCTEAVQPLHTLLLSGRGSRVVSYFHVRTCLWDGCVGWNEVEHLHLEVHFHQVGENALLIGSASCFAVFL